MKIPTFLQDDDNINNRQKQTCVNSSCFLGNQLSYMGIIVKYIHNSLAHYHTMPYFDALKIYSNGKHCEKKRNCL